MPFRERNPLVVGGIGVVVIGLLAVLAFNAQNLPFLSGTAYRAQFTEVGGLHSGDDVTIAGVRVGEVRGMAMDGDHVTVGFRVQGGRRLGGGTSAAIKVKTLLGQDVLALSPAGGGRLPDGGTIPAARTTPPYNVVQAIGQLTTETGRIDTGQLAQSLDTIASTFQDTPQAVRGTVDGLSRLSRTIASRDTALRDLLARADRVSTVLADRSGKVTALVREGDQLLGELSARRQVIDDLLRDTARLGQQVSAAIDENQGRIAPALDQLNQVLDMLRRNRASLEKGIRLMAPFLRLYTNAFGSGRWFDGYIENLGTPPGAIGAAPKGSSASGSSGSSGTGSGLPSVLGASASGSGSAAGASSGVREGS
jgi:phospholipid/cholesterol/gamma-HCH transport system substrate-binding protein